MNNSSMFVKTDVENLVKDIKSNAVINTANSDLKAYKKQKKRMKQVDSLESDLESLKAEIATLKKHMEQIVHGTHSD